jgi:hypothetical protein
MKGDNVEQKITRQSLVALMAVSIYARRARANNPDEIRTVLIEQSIDEAEKLLVEVSRRIPAPNFPAKGSGGSSSRA